MASISANRPTFSSPRLIPLTMTRGRHCFFTRSLSGVIRKTGPAEHSLVRRASSGELERVMARRVGIADSAASRPPPRMTKPSRLLFLTAAVAAATLGGATHALARDNSGEASSRAFGISARIAQLNTPDIHSGDVAGWVGVGGHGPHGSNEWLRVGSLAFPGITGGDIYYEVALPGTYPSYHEVSTGVAVGTYVKATVLEMYNRPNWWRVWVNHKAVSPPIRLPQSHDGLMPTVKLECRDGGTGGMCNDFPYSFRNV